MPSCYNLAVSSAVESTLDAYSNCRKGLFVKNSGSCLGKQTRATEDEVVDAGSCSKPPTSTSKSGLRIQDKGHLDEYGAVHGEIYPLMCAPKLNFIILIKYICFEGLSTPIEMKLKLIPTFQYLNHDLQTANEISYVNFLTALNFF